MPTSRRHFLQTTGCLTIGFSLLGPTWAKAATEAADELPGSLGDYPRIDSWLEVLADGRVRVLTGKIELGQGIRIAVAQMAAEELNIPLNRVDVVLAETDRTPNEGYTAGSGSIENSATAVRYAAAAARQKLLALAATQLQARAFQLKTQNGVVTAPNGQTRTFAQLLGGQQLTDEVRLPVALKPKAEYQYVGKAVPRPEIERMVRAQEYYVQDLRFPGMLHARVLRPFNYDSKLVQFDEKELKRAVPGLAKAVVNGSFVGLLAEREYDAKLAQDWGKLHVRWTEGKVLPAGQPLKDYLRTLPNTPKRVQDKGTPTNAPTLRASYYKPYLMHGSIGPSCAVARYDDTQRRLEVWTHSQGVYPLREALADLLKMPVDTIHVKGVPGSGCYGHNGADDVAADAALLAVATPGRHVRVQWAREDEHCWEPYGSAMVLDLAARLDPATGRLTHWHQQVWIDTHSSRPGGNADKLLPAQYLAQPRRPADNGATDPSAGGYRNADPLYTIPNLRVDAYFFQGPLRVSALRALGAYGNVFAIESFMDELAEKAGLDAWDFRLRNLQDKRAIAVVERARAIAHQQQVGENEGLGFAFAQYKNKAAYVAVVAKVSIHEEGTPYRPQLWAVIDAGEVINLDGLKNQTEGGMIQSASWALMEEVKFDRYQVRSRHWEAYPIFHFDEIPYVDVTVIDRPTEPPLGAGEAAQGPTAAALANAVYRATGKRVRELPLRPEKLTREA
ncbi:xanthine dehydrogenase family protein molybdopterin-binding subunit [Hymenobacter defluvii]|uniref:Xanthine dehydrogenase family protein molybdopterin-binding subunit n=1 Tax=Hymenobacter defluvii TaxID=2054411 RepID=A0ABS3TB63_9BACT|nr:molybdopterin cofactor-binding domain-containing protein [Hymenobacter defluvii]MBO3270894.1 xanthine dehydrogenase family protein molybdopterin-binding subunit [Hymenobacter defluvii]